MEETSPTIRTDVGMRYNAAEISRSLLQKKKGDHMSVFICEKPNMCQLLPPRPQDSAQAVRQGLTAVNMQPVRKHQQNHFASRTV